MNVLNLRCKYFNENDNGGCDFNVGDCCGDDEIFVNLVKSHFPPQPACLRLIAEPPTGLATSGHPSQGFTNLSGICLDVHLSTSTKSYTNVQSNFLLSIYISKESHHFNVI